MNAGISRLFATALLASAMLAACAAPGEVPYTPPPAGLATVPAPAVRPGAYWDYAVRDRYTGAQRGIYRYSVSRVDPDRVVVDVTRDGERIDTYVYAPGWRGLEHPLRNLQRLRYAPALPSYLFPLYPGQTWRGVVNSNDPATGRNFQTHVHASVGGWRRIRVPAGEYDAIEVRRQIFAGNQDSFNSQEEIFETDWYAPAIGQVVVSEGNSSHIDTSRSAGGRGYSPLVVRGEWLIAELVGHSAP